MRRLNVVWDFRLPSGISRVEKSFGRNFPHVLDWGHDWEPVHLKRIQIVYTLPYYTSEGFLVFGKRERQNEILRFRLGRRSTFTSRSRLHVTVKVVIPPCSQTVIYDGFPTLFCPLELYQWTRVVYDYCRGLKRVLW